MSNHALPPCTAVGCKRAGGAIINQSLLCAEHAAIEIERVLSGRKAEIELASASAQEKARARTEK